MSVFSNMWHLWRRRGWAVVLLLATMLWVPAYLALRCGIALRLLKAEKRKVGES